METFDTLTLKAASQGYEDGKYPRTDTKFARLPLSVLDERGIHSPQFNLLLKALPAGTVIAGGYPASLVGPEKQAADIDLFFLSASAFRDTVEVLVGYGYEAVKADPRVMGAYALKFGKALDECPLIQFAPPFASEGLPVQVIKISWYESAEHVIDNFDFTCTQFAVDVAKKELVFNPVSFIDLAQKRLVLHRTESPESVRKRVGKYIAKGFHAHGATLANIILGRAA
jgi:hypothetical protein